jgi:hypothetical protein
VKLGQHLIVAGVIDYAQLNAALERCAQTGERVGAALIALGHATYDQITGALATQHGVPAAKERQLNLTQLKGDLLPAELAREVGALTIGVGRDRELIVAFADPQDAAAVKRVEQVTGRIVTPTVASTGRLGAAIAKAYADRPATIPPPVSTAPLARPSEPEPPPRPRVLSGPTRPPVPIAPGTDIASAAAAAASALAERPARRTPSEAALSALSIAARPSSRSDPGAMAAAVEAIQSPLDAAPPAAPGPPSIDAPRARDRISDRGPPTSPPAFPNGTLDLEPASLPSDFARATPVETFADATPAPLEAARRSGVQTALGFSPGPTPSGQLPTLSPAELAPTPPVPSLTGVLASMESTADAADAVAEPAAAEPAATEPPPVVSRTKSGPIVGRTVTGAMRRPNLPGGTAVGARSPAVVIGWIVGFAIIAAAAFFTYRHFSAEETWPIPDRYTSSHLKVRMELPSGGGWRGHEELRTSRTEGPRWVRTEGYYRGASHTDPAEALMVLRAHTPGAFPAEVDLDDFQRKLDQLGRQVISAGNVMVPNLKCALETGVRTEPAGSCRGTGTHRDQTSEFYMLFWEDSVDDFMAVIYVAKGSTADKLDDVKTFISGITVQ